jgi:hypothetical protein
MKKILFTGILSILFVGISFAQTPRIGVTAGLNVSNITESGSGDKYKAGFQGGVVADFGITNSFSIIPELLFSQKGCSYDNGDGTTGSISLDYLVLPINAAYKFDVGMGSKVLIFAGPYFGYGVSATNGYSFGSNGDFKPFDFGINVGVGYEYEKFFVKLQVNPGLINISNTTINVDSNGNTISDKNMNIGVTVGYFFN